MKRLIQWMVLSHKVTEGEGMLYNEWHRKRPLFGSYPVGRATEQRATWVKRTKERKGIRSFATWSQTIDNCQPWPARNIGTIAPWAPPSFSDGASGKAMMRAKLLNATDPDTTQIAPAHQSDFRKGPRWERIIGCAAFIYHCSRRDERDDRKSTPTNLAAARVGGGIRKDTTIRREAMERFSSDNKPVALSNWAAWGGTSAVKMQNKITEGLIGGMVADSTRRVYQGQFARWTAHRSVLGHGPYLSSDPNDDDANEAAVIAYVVLNIGPLERDIGTVQNHLQAIGYFHKIYYGRNPLRSMTRLQNLMKGARREKGPTNRKMPVTIEDLNCIHSSVDWDNPDSVTLWCTIIIAWFFMLRMSEYLETGNQKSQCDEKRQRHPLLMSDIEPLIGGKKCEWSERVEEISIHISGSKTDYLNQGMIRSIGAIPVNEPNSHLCPVRALIRLWNIRPSKFYKNIDRTFATWSSGQPMRTEHLVSVLRMAVFSQGLNPNAFSLHSLRAGGATALYRATGNIELVARMGRWETSSISAYLWESHQVMRGLGQLMATGGHTLHRATRNLVSLRPEGVGRE